MLLIQRRSVLLQRMLKSDILVGFPRVTKRHFVHCKCLKWDFTTRRSSLCSFSTLARLTTPLSLRCSFTSSYYNSKQFFINLSVSDNCSSSFSMHRHFSTNCKSDVGYKLKNNLSDCYSLFNLNQDCTEKELKEAYLRLARQYHPDSGTSTAGSRQFGQINEAYIAIKEHLNMTRPKGFIADKSDDGEEFEFPYKLPQHQQYVGNEEIGFGSQRERQHLYQKYKVRQAVDHVYEYKISHTVSDSEDAPVAYKKHVKRNIISNSIERIVEDLILESMSKGDFDDLPGKGKPLEYDQEHPLVDTMTYNINKILINNGYAPEWITLEKEIRLDLKKARERLSVVKNSIGDPPWSKNDQARWQQHAKIFENNIIELNEKIKKFNMFVPASLLVKQRMPYNVEKEIRRVSEKYLDFLPVKGDTTCESNKLSDYFLLSQSGEITWRDVWKNIKESFFGLKLDSNK